MERTSLRGDRACARAGVTQADLRSAWWTKVATGYARFALRRRVEGIYLAGSELLHEAASGGPVVLVTNHGSWWDTFVLLVVSRYFALRGYALMDEENLGRLAFFGRVGALPLARSDGVRASLQLSDAAACLCAPYDAVWMFADGAQRPFHGRPLVFKKGAARLAAEAQASAVPCAISLVWRDRPEPAILVSFGAAVRGDTASSTTELLAQSVTDLLDAQTDAATRGDMPPCIFVGTRDRTDNGLATRLLSAVCRPWRG